MADITSLCTFKIAPVGDSRILTITTNSAAAAGDTIDLNSDIANGYGATMSDVDLIIMTSTANNVHSNAQPFSASWVRSSGVITISGAPAAYYKLVVFGR